MSYDLLLGYTGIISFGHSMFFGIGAYSMGIFMWKTDHTWFYAVLAVLAAVILAILISLVVGALTLRLKRFFLLMLTLVLGEFFLILAERWRSLTNGSDGFTFRIPELIDHKLIFCYLAVLFLIAVYALLRRFTHSPLGRVLRAIRDNEQRVEALGYNVFYYKMISNIVAGVVAALAGVMYALGMKFVHVHGVFGLQVVFDALVITIVGGVGTLSGAIVGSGLLEVVRIFLEKLAKVHPIFDRWLLFFGIAYIAIVMFFPRGIIGTTMLKIREKELKNNRLKMLKEDIDGKGPNQPYGTL